MTIFHMLSNSTKHNFSSLEKQTNFSSNNNYGRYSTLPEKLGGFIPETRFSPLFSCLQFYFFLHFYKNSASLSMTIYHTGLECHLRWNLAHCSLL